jgi:hypothetical protein
MHWRELVLDRIVQLALHTRAFVMMLVLQGITSGVRANSESYMVAPLTVNERRGGHVFVGCDLKRLLFALCGFLLRAVVPARNQKPPRSASDALTHLLS